MKRKRSNKYEEILVAATELICKEGYRAASLQEIANWVGIHKTSLFHDYVPTARIGLTEARVGMGANFGTHKLARMVPLGIALEHLFTGETFSAEEAYRWGLVNQVVPPEELMAAAEETAERILACASLSIRRMKENAMKGLELPLPYAVLLNLGPDVYTSEDKLEGSRAFAEKRKPNWKGR